MSNNKLDGLQIHLLSIQGLDFSEPIGEETNERLKLLKEACNEKQEDFKEWYKFYSKKSKKHVCSIIR